MNSYREIPTDNGDVLIVSPYSIRAGNGGPSGTLYHGDAELIQDFLAEPTDELDIYGCIHHIHLTTEGDDFRLTIDFMGHIGSVVFGQAAARDVIFALAFARPSDSNPNRLD